MLKSLTAKLTPDSEGALVGLMVWLFGVHWRTSTSGIASFLMGMFGLATTGVTALALQNPHGKIAVWSASITAALTFFSGVLKLWIGLISQDAGTVGVKIPQQADPVPVPSHEVPDAKLPKGAQIAKENP